MLVRDELPRQALRQRGHRPAVRAADDRRGTDAARALRADRRRRRQRRVHALGRAHGAALRDAAVRRAHRAAGAARARPRDGGGGGARSAPAGSRSSGASSSRTSCRRSSRASRSRSRARSASSARSILIAGNLPFKTEVASLYVFEHINSDDPTGAAALAVAHARDLVRRPPRASARSAAGRRAMTARYEHSRLRARLPRRDPRRAASTLIFWRAFEHGAASVLGGDLEPERGARVEADARGHARSPSR